MKVSMKIFLLVAAIIGSLSAVKIRKPFFQVNTNEDIDDYEVTIIRKGHDNEVRLKDKFGNNVTTYNVLASQGYEVERPEGADVCYVRHMFEEDGFGLDCDGTKLLSPQEVSKEIAENCVNRQIYAVRPVACSGVQTRRAGGCHVGCWLCWGICCGWRCD